MKPRIDIMQVLMMPAISYRVGNVDCWENIDGITETEGTINHNLGCGYCGGGLRFEVCGPKAGMVLNSKIIII